MVPLTETQLDALVAVQAAWPHSEVVMIGALALGHHIPMDHRTTDDLDLLVAVSMADFPGPLASLSGWRRHPKMEHRFFSPDDQMLDVLPAGGDLIAKGYVEWSSGERMSLIGFDLAFSTNVRVGLGVTSVLVPTAPVLAFLKMRAWMDRPSERTKDLADLGQLLRLYVGDDDDRRFEDDLLHLGLDFDDVSPFALGRDLARVVRQSPHAAEVDAFVEKATPEKLAAYGHWSSADHAEQARDAFVRGMDQGRKEADDGAP